MLDGLDADRRGEVRLARARTADEDYIVRILQKLAAVKLSYERLVDFATGEVEAGKVAIVWETGRLELVGRRSDLPVGRLFRSCDRIGSAASKAGEPCSVSSPTA